MGALAHSPDDRKDAKEGKGDKILGYVPYPQN